MQCVYICIRTWHGENSYHTITNLRYLRPKHHRSNWSNSLTAAWVVVACPPTVSSRRDFACWSAFTDPLPDELMSWALPRRGLGNMFDMFLMLPATWSYLKCVQNSSWFPENSKLAQEFTVRLRFPRFTTTRQLRRTSLRICYGKAALGICSDSVAVLTCVSG